MATKIENAFERILNRLEDSDEGVQSKTAAVASEPLAEARMLETVRRVSSAASTKTASASAPAADLQRMAKHAQALEEQAMVKEAHFMGSAIADGFMERFAQYDVALNNAGVKTASANPAMVKAAAEQGYRMAVADMEKTAAAEYNRGYEDTLRGVHKLASEIHYGGQSMAHDVLVGLNRKTAGVGQYVGNVVGRGLGGAAIGGIGGALGAGEGHRMEGAGRGAMFGGALGAALGLGDEALAGLRGIDAGSISDDIIRGTAMADTSLSRVPRSDSEMQSQLKAIDAAFAPALESAIRRDTQALGASALNTVGSGVGGYYSGRGAGEQG